MARIRYYDSATDEWLFADLAVQAPLPDGTAVGDTFVWDGTDWVLKAEVPNLYKEVDYIQSTGTQYIQLNFPLSSESTSIITCDGVAADNVFVFGCGTTYSSEAFALRSISATTTGTTDGGMSIYFDDNAYHTTAPAGTKDAKTVYMQDKGDFYVNGELITSMTATGTPVSDYNACLFTANVGGTISGKCSTKLYGAKFYENGAVVSILVPCIRLSDDVAGLYDVVQQQFFTNAGTGSFATPFPIKEDTANKLKSVSGGGAGITSAATDTQYPSAKAVYDFVDTLVGNADTLLGSGVIS